LESAISALESAITALDNSSVLWDTWLLPIFTGLVVAGLIADVVVVCREHKGEMNDWRRGIVRPPDRPSTGKFRLELFATIAIFLGVAGELVAGIRIATINGELRTKNAELRRKSNELVALLHVEAEDAQKAAGEANERAEEMKEALAPRRLTTKQRSAISSTLSRFSGQPVTVVHNTFDTEAAVFAAQMLSTLKLAKWTMSTVGVSGPLFRWAKAPSITIPGIFIEAATDKRSQLAARALSQELSSNGFDCRIRKNGLIGTLEKPPVVLIDVEPRPEGPQGDAKLRTEAEKKQKAKSSPSANP
jgi:hypothetical protein